MEINTVIQGDCLEVMQEIESGSVDMILCDLPYGTTNCHWDVIIPFDKLWEQYKRIIKSNGAIVLTGQEPFSSYLRISNIKKYRYDWYWQKTKYSNFLCLSKQPAKNCENVCIFYDKQPTYNPEMINGKPYKDNGRKKALNNQQKLGVNQLTAIDNKGLRYPSSIIAFSNGNNNNVHPTQKPVALFEYLIKTYTNEGELVLDNCAGSGTTGEACLRTNRNYILIEKEQKYVDIINKRISDLKAKNSLLDL